MRRLHTKVNLIPVIAKADTLTDDEVGSDRVLDLALISNEPVLDFG
jgi:septin family protein